MGPEVKINGWGFTLPDGWVKTEENEWTKGDTKLMFESFHEVFTESQFNDLCAELSQGYSPVSLPGLTKVKVWKKSNSRGLVIPIINLPCKVYAFYPVDVTDDGITEVATAVNG